MRRASRLLSVRLLGTGLSIRGLCSTAPVLLLLLSCASPTLVRVHSQASPRGTLIRSVDVFPATPNKPMLRGVDVLLVGNRIARISPTRLRREPGVTVIDGRGLTLMPGLIDFHTHVTGGMSVPWKPLILPDYGFNMQAALYAGITSVVDLSGEATAKMKARASAIRRGKVIGPRLFTAGRGFTVSGGHPRRMGQFIASQLPWFLGCLVPQIGDVVDRGPAPLAEHLRAQPDLTKVFVDRMPSDARLINQAQLEAVVRQSHAAGVKVIAHVGTADNLRAALKSGVDGAAHIVYKEDIPETLARRVAARKMFVVPTLVVWDTMHRLTATERLDFYRPLERTTWHPSVRAAVANRQPFGPFPKVWTQWQKRVSRANPSIFRNTRMLHKAGVRILAGSDSPNFMLGIGGSLHRELMLLVRSGLSPAEALRAATYSPAYVLGRADRIGQVRVGHEVDLILVRGDPTTDITKTQQVVEVFFRGRRLAR